MSDLPLEYPPLEGPPPVVWDDSHARAAEDGLRGTAFADAILRQCEACNIPTTEIRKDCDGLCRFFQGWLKNYRDQQSQNVGPVV